MSLIQDQENEQIVESVSSVESIENSQKEQAPKKWTAYAVAGIAALGGLLFGYDTGVISGATLFLQKDFAFTPLSEEIAVSCILVGCIVGAAIGGKLIDVLGRRMMLIITSLVFAVGAILTGVAPDLTTFILCRVFVGLAIGVASLVVPIFIAEKAPPSLRGALVTFDQLAITVGIAVAYWVDLAFANANMGWRPMFAVAAIPGIVLLVGMFFLNETPRWLASKGRWEDADRSLSETVQGAEKEAELQAIRSSLEEEKKFSKSEIRHQLFHGKFFPALVVAVGLAGLQQLVGINTVIYYAPTIFGYAGFHSASGAILATSVVGVVNVLATIVSAFLFDRVGRKPLLLVSTAGVAITLAALGIVFAMGASNAGYLVLICLLAYIISFAIGLGPCVWIINSEIFPTHLRAMGGSIAAMSNWVANLLVSITFLSLLNALGTSLVFWLYAVVSVGALIFFWLRIPETKGKTLEQIEHYWTDRPSAHHMR